MYCTYRADSWFAPSQWERVLLCNDVSHWLGANLESTLYTMWCHYKTLTSTFYKILTINAPCLHSVIKLWASSASLRYKSNAWSPFYPHKCSAVSSYNWPLDIMMRPDSSLMLISQWHHIKVILSAITGKSTDCSMGESAGDLHKWPVTQKAFPWCDIIMMFVSNWLIHLYHWSNE